MTIAYEEYLARTKRLGIKPLPVKDYKETAIPVMNKDIMKRGMAWYKKEHI
jgi:hypothetical protein